MDKLRVDVPVKLDEGTACPRHAMPGDAGLDLTAAEAVEIGPGGTAIVGTGASFAIPEGLVGLVFPRSGLASKGHVNLANCVGVVDSGYRGEVKAALHNFDRDRAKVVAKGDRVCQMVVVPYVECTCVPVDELDGTERGAGGFGSTGGTSGA